jgi:hypothetical protein
MRRSTFCLLFCITSLGYSQTTKPSPTEELRITVSQWVETMTKIQQEENDWKRDLEILANYKEGLEAEIKGLQEQIAAAETRKLGATSESSEKINERNRYVDARGKFASELRRLEQKLIDCLPLLPQPLKADPKVAQSIEELERDLKRPADQLESNLSKRLLNVINLTTEAEKFQQTVHVRPELHRDASGQEFNMQVVYFGLAAAYAVNEDGSLALSGKPGANGWTFEETPQLSMEIRNLIASTTGAQDAAFIQLPFSKP